jgi:MFS family permease
MLFCLVLGGRYRMNMSEPSYFRLQLTVFAVVSATFANVYITQPVLPVLREEFGTDMVTISFTISAVILGIALSNLPFGYLADRWPIHPILLLGGVLVALGAGVCDWTHQLYVLIGARFFQGLFIPALTTCLAAYLSKTLPVERLTVVMGAYVSATVVGGLGGRLLGGLIHSPLHWRFAFVTAGGLIRHSPHCQGMDGMDGAAQLVHRVFHCPCRGHRPSESAAFRWTGQSQRPLRAVLLHGRMAGDYGFRIGLWQIGLAGRCFPGVGDVDTASGYRPH